MGGSVQLYSAISWNPDPPPSRLPEASTNIRGFDISFSPLSSMIVYELKIKLKRTLATITFLVKKRSTTGR